MDNIQKAKMANYMIFKEKINKINSRVSFLQKKLEEKETQEKINLINNSL